MAGPPSSLVAAPCPGGIVAQTGASAGYIGFSPRSVRMSFHARPRRPA
ncbi:MAG: hypothetical protein MZV64_64110 [Ignavibacteriales bacterium]|nr:hypothetical protein [Ignavibacteriales bacterium]